MSRACPKSSTGAGVTTPCSSWMIRTGSACWVEAVEALTSTIGCRVARPTASISSPETLGKALGGAAGGYVAGPREVIDHLIQRSRPQLFSNALPPTVACSAAKALEILEGEPDRLSRLRANTETMRDGLKALGYEVVDSPTAIIPIIIGDTAEALRLSDRLLADGIMVVGFGFPVVPEGTARLRVQMSAAHTAAHIEAALDAFARIRPTV